MRGNSLHLLCVFPGERGKGAGTRLFSAAADYIRAQGHTRIEIGSPDSELFIGAPEDSCGFFEKLGCTFGEKVAEMSAGKLELPEEPQSGAEFGGVRLVRPSGIHNKNIRTARRQKLVKFCTKMLVNPVRVWYNYIKIHCAVRR